MRNIFVLVFGTLAGIAPAIMFSPIAFSQSEDLVTRDLAQSADVIVVGKVHDVRSEWSDDRSRIVTKTTIQVEQIIKGDNAKSSVTISTLGGEIDGIGELYSHTARFNTNEQVIVFASTDSRGQLRVIGGDEGKITVISDESTGLRTIADGEPLSAFTSRLKRVIEAQNHKK